MSLLKIYMEAIADESERKLELSKTQAFKDYVKNTMRDKNLKDKNEFISHLLGNNSLKALEKLIY